MKSITVPQLGESISEAIIAQWHKEVGEYVKEGDILVDLETDKITLEVPAPVSGKISKIFFKENAEVKTKDILCDIEESSEDTSAVTQHMQKDIIKQESVQQSAPFVLSPAVRKLVMQNNINVQEIVPSGPKNNITKEDVLNFIQKNTAIKTSSDVVKQSATFTQSVNITEELQEEIIPMSSIRKTIARRLKDAQNTAVMLTTFNEINMDNIMSLRKKYKETFLARYDTRLGMMSFFVKACALALKEFPDVNAGINGNNIVYKNYYNINVAISSPKGLVVPVINHVDKKTFADIETEIIQLAKKANNDKLTIADMSGGTFTITNGGIFGSLFSTPIINPPQSAILAMHGIKLRPIVNEKAEITTANMMYLALSYDHRIIDGKDAVLFLSRIKQLVEDVDRLLLEV